MQRGVHPPHGARVECADDEREPLIPTPAYPLTAARFPAFALARFGFAGDNGRKRGQCAKNQLTI